MLTVTVDLPDQPYPIHIGKNLFRERRTPLAAYIKPGSKVLVIMDGNTHKDCFPVIDRCLREGGAEPIEFIGGGGENDKTIDTLICCYERMARSGFDRDSTVIALGGGVVGDLAGFVASTYMRGIRLINIPTTLLSMVDSAIGGKNGINFPWGKNVVGTFYQPCVVVVDLAFLDSLPKRAYLDGMAEIIKYGVLNGTDFLIGVRDRRARMLARDEVLLKEVVERCCSFKAKIVEKDEREDGMRAILNFGHTIGHALEAAGSYSSYTHGQALSVGMRGACLLSYRLGLTGEDTVETMEAILSDYELPVTWRIDGVFPKDVWKYLEKDKKARGGRLNFILTKGFGSVIIRDIKEEKGLILKVLDDLRR